MTPCRICIIVQARARRMLRNFCRRNIVGKSAFPGKISKRCFLSDAYRCSEAWNGRLKSPIFQQFNADNVWHQLNRAFLANQRINVLDIDLYANVLDSTDGRYELEELITKLRDCPECVLLPERTTHAILRYYIDNTASEDVLGLLSNRTRFGVFPDHYLNNILMDKYVKGKDPVSAVKIAVLQMLQEDFDHPITSALSLYTCYNYLASSEVWKSPKPPVIDPDDDDVERIRVPYLRNPFFDDHFDVAVTNHLVGKTMWMVGCHVGGSLGASSQLIGLVLYEKYDRCKSLLADVAGNKVKLHTDAVTMAVEFLKNKPKQPVEEVTKKEGEEQGGEAKPNEEKQCSDAENADDPVKGQVLELLEKLDKKNLVGGTLLQEVEKLVKEMVAKNEEKDIAHQCQLYKQWEQDRLDHIQREIDREKLLKLKAEIAKTKAELDEEEKKLFYYDNEDEWEMKIEKQKELMANVVYFKGKGKYRELTEEVYVPPDVKQKKN